MTELTGKFHPVSKLSRLAPEDEASWDYQQPALAFHGDQPSV